MKIKNILFNLLLLAFYGSKSAYIFAAEESKGTKRKDVEALNHDAKKIKNEDESSVVSLQMSNEKKALLLKSIRNSENELMVRIKNTMAQEDIEDVVREFLVPKNNDNLLYNLELFKLTNKAIPFYVAPLDPVNCMAMSSDGEFIIMGFKSGIVDGINLQTGDLLFRINHNNHSVNFVAISSDNSLIAAGLSNKTVVLTRIINNQTEQLDVIQHTSTVNSVAISTDKSFVVTAAGKTAQIIDVETGLLNSTIDHDNTIIGVAISSDDKLVITCSYDTKMKITNIETGEVRLIDLNDWSFSVAISPDSNIIVAALSSSAKIFDFKTGQLLHTINHNGPVKSIAISSDSNYVITVSDDETVKITDLKTGQLLNIINNKDLKCVALSSNNKLVIASLGQIVKLFDLTNPKIGNFNFEDFTFDQAQLINWLYNQKMQNLTILKKDLIINLDQAQLEVLRSLPEEMQKVICENYKLAVKI